MGNRLPDLGPRGEGWVAGQAILLGLVALLGLPGLGSLPPTTVGRWLLLGSGLLLLVAGMAIGLAGVRALGPALTAAPRPKPGAPLVLTGIYRSIRHPLYVAVVTTALGWAIAMASTPAVIASVLLAGWMDAKARREEAWLLETHPGYDPYRRRTRRFIPRIY